MLHNSITSQETTTFFLFLIFITSVLLYWFYSSSEFPLHCLCCFYGFFVCSRYNSRFCTLQAFCLSLILILYRYWSNLAVWAVVSEAYKKQKQVGTMEFLVLSRLRHRFMTYSNLKSVVLMPQVNPKVSHKDSAFLFLLICIAFSLCTICNPQDWKVIL